jgi:predicted ATPase
MTASKKIDKLTIRGFQSIKSLDALQLNDLNILIGANGAGKSNFVTYFRMLSEMVEQRLQLWVSKQGGADRILSFGVKHTPQMSSFIKFGANGYKFSLEPTNDERFTFTEEQLYHYFYRDNWTSLGSGHNEAKLKDRYRDSKSGSVAEFCYSSISRWKVFHFHDTSDTAGVKRLGALHDHEYLRSDASNLAAFLYRLYSSYEDVYNEIRKVVQLAIPFFDDFVLQPQTLPSGEQQIQLMWNQRDSDYPFLASQLSDGSLRFICLATVLLQPNPPSTVIIDEPELGLHPYAITLLGSLMRSAAKQMQIIVSTQSVPLLNEFSIDDLIVVEREDGVSTFKRLDEPQFQYWLEDYSIGELWEKNVLGGRPSR